jgi:hypothetical protein
MAYCRGDGKVPGITLRTWADPCPWHSLARSCKHSAQISNGRPTAIYNVEIMSKPIFGQVSLDGAPYVIKLYKMIPQGRSTPVESFDIRKCAPSGPSWSAQQTERITTTATYLPASYWGPDEEEGQETKSQQDDALNKICSIVARYEFDVP